MAGEYIEFDNNNQPAINDTNLNRLQQLIKQDIQGAVSGDTLPIGTIVPFGSNTVPENWLLCDGSAVSRTTYQDLFNTIGITFGQGDGFETFNLPDLRDKVPVGKDSNDTDFNLLGNTGGEKKHTLTIQEMPSHRHGHTNNLWAQNEGYGNINVGPSTLANRANVVSTNSTTTGGGEPHNILQPYIVINYIIKAFQSAGTVATVVDNLNSTSTTDALSANQGNVLKELLNGTVLYNNASGSSATITLSESSANFKRIQIEYFENRENAYGTIDVLNPNGKSVWLHNYFVGSNSYIYFTKITISGTQITWDRNGRYNLNSDAFNTDYIQLITKVTGYNY